MIEFERYKRSDEYNEWFSKLDKGVYTTLLRLLDKYK